MWFETCKQLPRLLPNVEQVEVIVAIKGATATTTLWFDGESFTDEAGDTYNVTHWMPLPVMPRR